MVPKMILSASSFSPFMAKVTDLDDEKIRSLACCVHESNDCHSGCQGTRAEIDYK